MCFFLGGGVNWYSWRLNVSFHIYMKKLSFFSIVMIRVSRFWFAVEMCTYRNYLGLWGGTGSG